MKIIKNFNLDTSNIKAAGETRLLTVSGDNGAVFSLEIKSGTTYYNFETNLFQATKTRLSDFSITSNSYARNIIFPTVAAGAQYDVLLFAENNYDTKHAEYIEARFDNNSIDINSSTGSNSNLVQKVLYQTLDVTITIEGHSPNSTVTGANTTSATIVAQRNKNTTTIPFTHVFTVTSTRTLSIDTQPTSNDIMAFVTATTGATPIYIEGEDIYPAVTETDVVNGDFGDGTTNKIVMDTNVVDKMIIDDRITTAVMTDTVDGAVDASLRIVMDNNVATKMAVGDRITATGAGHTTDTTGIFDKNVIIVEELDPDGDNAKEFSVSQSVSVNDGTTLSFSSQLNREIVTVAALNPDTDNAKEFSMKNTADAAINIGIRDNATLSFSNQRNHRWSFSNIDKLLPGMRQVKSTFFTTEPTIKEYLTQTTISEGTADEYRIDNVRIPALEAVGTATTPSAPVFTRDGTTKVETVAQTGNVTFSEQALLTFGGGANGKIFSYGPAEIESLTGYNVEFSDLAATLTTVSTTTTSAVNSSTSVPITDRAGIMEGISSISGIGINTAIAGTDTVDGAVTSGIKVVMDTNVAETMSVGDRITGNVALNDATVTVAALNPDGDNVKEFSMSEAIALGDGLALNFSNQRNSGPKVSDGAGSVIGAGTIVLSAAQTLENGAVLTFPGAGTIVTVTGNIKINNVGNEDVTLRFDLEKFLTMH